MILLFCIAIAGLAFGFFAVVAYILARLTEWTYALLKARFVIPLETAIQWEMTHHGKLFGVPVWMEIDQFSTDVFGATAKFTPLNYWLRFCDWIIDVRARFSSVETIIETPFKVIKAIEVKL